jgi:hypothetical protein
MQPADLPTSPESTTATFANDTAVVATDLTCNSKLGLKWKMKANESITRRRTCPPGPYKQCAPPPRRRCQVS